MHLQIWKSSKNVKLNLSWLWIHFFQAQQASRCPALSINVNVNSAIVLYIQSNTAVFNAGLHDNVPDPDPSAKVAPVGCQLATMALGIKTVAIPKGWWVARQKLSPNLRRPCIWAELHETGGFSATLAENRLGRRHATRPCSTTLSLFLWAMDTKIFFLNTNNITNY